MIQFLFVMVYAIVGHHLFALNAPDKFGSFPQSLYTVRARARRGAVGDFIGRTRSYTAEAARSHRNKGQQTEKL